MFTFFSTDVNLFFRPLALTISLISFLYSSVVALRQLDLKRQIAFSSIAHMSFVVLGLFTYTEIGVKGAVYLMLSHGLTSSGLFYLVGILSDRYHRRSVIAYSGLMSIRPLFYLFLLINSLANVGFPGRSGFLPELFIMLAVIRSMRTLIIPVLLGMFYTTAGSLIMLLRLSFGHVKVRYYNSNFADITKLEFIVLSTMAFYLLVFGLHDVLEQFYLS
jgi:NADH-quinone oxidoreductase subunit M